MFYWTSNSKPNANVPCPPLHIYCKVTKHYGRYFMAVNSKWSSALQTFDFTGFYIIVHTVTCAKIDKLL